MPLQELSNKSLDAIGIGENTKEREIVTYCRSGGRSKEAQKIMEQLGYKNIKNIAGGIINWQEKNYPFIKEGK